MVWVRVRDWGVNYVYGSPQNDTVEACVCVTDGLRIPLKPNKLQVVELDSEKHDFPQ